MLKVSVVSLCLGAALLFGSSTATAGLKVAVGPMDAGEVKVRQEIFYGAKQKFIASDFAGLDQLIDEYRANKSRTPSGVWKLTLAYKGIVSVFDDAAEKSWADLDRALEKTREWQRLCPRSSAARISTSLALLKYAETIRGGGYASTVKPEAWAPFKRLVGQARENLENSKDADASDPQWYRTMLQIAIYEGWGRDQFDQLFRDAIAKEPLFYETYFVAFTYLLPRWHGDLNEVEAFAQDSVKWTSKTEGTGMYARIYWYASQDSFGDNLFKESKVDWKKMKVGFGYITTKYPDAWNFNNYARFACLAGDKAEARELTTRIQNSVIPHAWPVPSDYTKCYDWSHSVEAARDAESPRHN